MDVTYSVLTNQDIPFMKENIEQDGEFCAENLAEFIEEPNAYGFIARLGEEVSGFAYGYNLKHPHIAKNDFFLYSIGIMEQYQNKGIGSGLIGFIKKFAFDDLKCGEVFVLTDKGNSRACRVYEKAGGKNEYEDEICYVIYDNRNST